MRQSWSVVTVASCGWRSIEGCGWRGPSPTAPPNFFGPGELGSVTPNFVRLRPNALALGVERFDQMRHVGDDTIM
jgi:hypothetical protein